MSRLRMTCSKTNVFEAYSVVYSPREHPGRYVLRRFRITPECGLEAHAHCGVFRTLSDARHEVPTGLTRTRDDDDPVIVEYYL